LFFFWTPPIFKPHNFLIFIHLKQFKVLNSTNHFGTLIAIEQHKRNFWVFRNQRWQCSVVCFFEFLTPFTSGSCNFLISNPFLTIVSVADAPRGGIQICFNTKNNRDLPLHPACPEHLSVRSPTSLPYDYVFVRCTKSPDFFLFFSLFFLVMVFFIIP
jgi:hypothetical protein